MVYPFSIFHLCIHPTIHSSILPCIPLSILTPIDSRIHLTPSSSLPFFLPSPHLPSISPIHPSTHPPAVHPQ